MSGSIGSGTTPISNDKPSIFDALQELGLKLSSDGARSM
jgi:hypothetical protein